MQQINALEDKFNARDENVDKLKTMILSFRAKMPEIEQRLNETADVFEDKLKLLEQ